MVRLHDILDYEVLETLGYGARSTIFAVKDKTNHVYALKRVVRYQNADQRFIDQAIHEHEVAVKFQHENLRRSFQLIRNRKFIRTNEVLVLMEMVDGQTFEQFRPADPTELCKLCTQVATGLDTMHQAGYVHADIKPNNILITDQRNVKLIDFGQSCPDGTIKERIQGTPDYIAPEQVKRKKITPRTDVFNLGATIYWLLTRRHVPTLIPKTRSEVGTRKKLGDACPPPHELNPAVPPALSALVMECVQDRPEDRPEDMSAVANRLDLALHQVKNRGSSAAASVD